MARLYSFLLLLVFVLLFVSPSLSRKFVDDHESQYGDNINSKAQYASIRSLESDEELKKISDLDENLQFNFFKWIDDHVVTPIGEVVNPILGMVPKILGPALDPSQGQGLGQ